MPGPDYYEWQKLKREHSSVSFTGFASLEKETRSEMFRRVLVVFLLVSALDVGSSVKTDSGGLRRVRRAVDDHGHEDDDHAEEDTVQCTVTKAQLVQAFNEVATELDLRGSDDQVCALPVPECHHHDDDEDGHHDDKEEAHEYEDVDGHKESGSGEGSGIIGGCVSVFQVCQELILHTPLASSSCLAENCLDEGEENATTSSSQSDRPSAAQAYGLGFLMVTLVSLGSLLGVFIVPLILTKDKTKTRTLVYKYMYFFMIALGTSALVSDAILHLFPHAWGLHAHEEDEGMDDGHAHEHDEAGGAHAKVEDFVWKGTTALLAMYLFYLLEYLLHGMSSHTHSHGFPTDEKECGEDGKECIQLDVGIPHGECGGTVENPGILHPATPSAPPSENGKSYCASCRQPLVNGTSSPTNKDLENKRKKKGGVLGWLKGIKPLAWLIIIGDGIHNFADGLALGAAISQSLTLGVSTTIALILHELPHEIGDYVILLSTGLTWYSALIFNLFSALTAVLGFFVGVGVGMESQEANSWILAFAAGLFIYIALVDLLPELIHTKEKGRHRFGLFFAANCGFFLSFLLLFLLAVYEEKLNNFL